MKLKKINFTISLGEDEVFDSYVFVPESYETGKIMTKIIQSSKLRILFKEDGNYQDIKTLMDESGETDLIEILKARLEKT